MTALYCLCGLEKAVKQKHKNEKYSSKYSALPGAKTGMSKSSSSSTTKVSEEIFSLRDVSLVSFVPLTLETKVFVFLLNNTITCAYT